MVKQERNVVNAATVSYTHLDVYKRQGLDTLSTKIYTEVKKGIKPEMYALSTLLFVSVLLLLLLINIAPNAKNKSARANGSK